MPRACARPLPRCQEAIWAPISASFGVTQMQAGDGLHDLVHRADAALYAAKKAGRDRVHAVSSEPVDTADPRLSGQAGS